MSDYDKLFEDMPLNPSLSYEPEPKPRRRPTAEEIEAEAETDGLPKRADLMMWTVVLSKEAPGEDEAPEEPRTRVASGDMIKTVQSPSREQLKRPPAAPARSSAAPEDHVPAQYELLKVIGAGGFGEVWEAYQRSLGRSVAVKRVRKELRARTPRDTRGAMAEVTFRQEAAITGLLEHPNIVPIHDLGVDDEGSPMLAMKLVRGEPWDRLIAKDFREMAPADFLGKHLPILVQMTQAVAFAHSRGIVHRDLKPSQVMTGEFGEVLLMDWGLALHFDRRRRPRDNQGELPINLLPEKLPTIQTASNPAGTPALMAPEQTYNDATRIGFWTDIYLLGGTLYYLLTGTFPHLADTSREAFKLAQAGEVQRPEERAPDRDVPPELSEIAMRALAKSPKERIPSAVEFLKLVQDFLSGAGRRRESRALAAEVREGLESSRSSYDGMASLLDTLNRAKNLWPENPELPELFEKTLNLYARQALAAGDLNLAQFEAEQIREGAVRDGLLHDIAEARKMKKAESRQHKLLSFAFVVLLVIIVAVWSVFNFLMRAERNELQRALDRSGQLSTEVSAQARELEAIYGVAGLMGGADLAEALAGIPAVVVGAVSYPENAVAALLFNGETFGTAAEATHQITAPIIVGGETRGELRVVYTSLPREARGRGFEASERKMIEHIATMISAEIAQREAKGTRAVD